MERIDADLDMVPISPQRYGRCESRNAGTNHGDVQTIRGITSHGERCAEIQPSVTGLLYE